MKRSMIPLLVVLSAACTTYELPGSLGDQCELNSDCDAPLVCRLGFCRVECASARDCAAGLDCVYDNMQRGACQLMEETNCVRASDCPEGLVCTMGECTNECNCGPDDVPCRDCPPGATCVERDGKPGQFACYDPADEVCVYDTDCTATETSFVCAPDGRCRVECRPHALDCRNGEECLPASFREDGGMVSGYLCTFVGASAMDGGTSDGAAAD